MRHHEMDSSRRQFSLRRLLILMLGWCIGLAVVARIPGGSFTWGCALMYGLFASVIFLTAQRRLLSIWFFSWVLITIATALAIYVSLSLGTLPKVLTCAYLPAEGISREQFGNAPSGMGLANSLVTLPILTGITLSPALATIVEIVICGASSILRSNKQSA